MTAGTPGSFMTALPLSDDDAYNYSDFSTQSQVQACYEYCLDQVATLLGHESLDTTRVYTRQLVKEDKVSNHGPQKRKVKGERELFTYMYLYGAAVLSAGRIREYQRDCMTTILYCALLLEAYLNHLGSRTFPEHDWEPIQRSSPDKKLRAIAQGIDYSLELGRRPFQSFTLIFKFRNDLVHGKTTKLPFEDEQFIERGKPPAYPETDWEKMLTIPFAERAFEDTKAMMQALHNAADLEHDLFTFNFRWKWEAS